MTARRAGTATGVAYAVGCLAILAAMPLLVGARPEGSSALAFAALASAWQLVFAAPTAFAEARVSRRRAEGRSVARDVRRRAIVVVAATGVIFTASTLAYVVAVDRAGPVAAAAATQAYPLFAALIERFGLGVRRGAARWIVLAGLAAALFGAATGGAFAVSALSLWFLFALSVPLMWSVAHVILRLRLADGAVTPIETTFVRVLVSTSLLAVAGLAFAPSLSVGAVDVRVQMAALAFGGVYFLELVLWFAAIRRIDVSLASAVTAPAPVVTAMAAAALAAASPTVGEIAAIVVATALIGVLVRMDARAED